MWENKEQGKNSSAKAMEGSAIYVSKSALRRNSLLNLQCALCAVLLLFVFFVRVLNGQFYLSMQQQFNTAIQKGIDFSHHTPMLRFIDESVTLAREAAADLSEQVKNSEQNDVLGIGGFTSAENADFTQSVSFEDYTLDEVLLQPAYGVASSDFGYRENPFNGEEDLHAGIDIAAPEGTSVVASLSGQVVEVGYTKERGNYIILHHRPGLQTLYQHLLCGFVRVGQKVVTGQQIGCLGSTGLVTGPHLHFELIIDGLSRDCLKEFPQLEQTLKVAD